MTQTIQENYSWILVLNCVKSWAGKQATQFSGLTTKTEHGK
jgi:hypothetical protein